jgi:hypothetical protein
VNTNELFTLVLTEDKSEIATQHTLCFGCCLLFANSAHDLILGSIYRQQMERKIVPMAYGIPGRIERTSRGNDARTKSYKNLAQGGAGHDEANEASARFYRAAFENLYRFRSSAYGAVTHDSRATSESTEEVEWNLPLRLEKLR